MKELIAPAKVNLYLHITNRRSDGYHELDSLVVFLEIGDRIRFKERASGASVNDLAITLDVCGEFSEFSGLVGDDNLIVQAAKKLQEYGKHQGPNPNLCGVDIVLEKRLPVGAGLGGGSSDAAAMVLALRNLWNIAINDSELAELMLPLGADLPVCLFQKSVLMQGIGETLIPLPLSLPKLYIVLLNPRVPVPTSKIYQQGNITFSTAANWQKLQKNQAMQREGKNLANKITLNDFLIWLNNNTNNDLQSSAVSIAPVILDVLGALEKQVGCQMSRMSGSGATCFGIFVCEKDAKNAEEKIKKEYSNWWVASGALFEQ